MKGSGTFEKQEDDSSSSNSSGDDTPDEIAFLPEAPVVSSPTRSRRVMDSLLIPEDKDMDPSFLICCCSPENSPKAGDLPSSGNVAKEFNRMVANSKNRTDDDSTCASTIHTEGFKDLKEKGKDVQYSMTPVENEAKKNKADEDSSCAEKIEMELGPYTSASTSYDDTNVEQEDRESAKRIKAEDLDNYEISEIVHGRRAYKSKTDEDGLPIPVSSPSETNDRRERRKKALEAHREYLYKSHSIDTNPSKDGTDNTGRKSRSTAFSDSTQTINDEKSSPREGGPSDLSNSIVQEGASAPTDGDQPDGLLSLVQNAFNGLISPKNEADTPDSGAKGDSKLPASDPEDGGDSKTPKAVGPVDDMLEAAFRFFAPKEEAEKAKESTEKSDEIEGKVSSTEYTEASDEAVLKNSKSYTSSDKAGETTEGNFFNADGIPLELRPNKIWRVFDSGFNAAASALTGPSAVAGESGDNDRGDSKPNENQETEGTTLDAAQEKQEQVPVDQPLDSILSIRTEGYYLKSDGSEADERPARKNPVSPTKLKLETETKELEASVQRLANSARYQRRNEMKRMRARRLQQERSTTRPAVDPEGDKAAEEILAVSPPQSPVSPTIRGWFGFSEHDQNGTPPTQSEEELRVPPSPVAAMSPVSPVSPSQYNNISDIRSRIKQRQRRRQQQEQHQSDTTATTVSKKPSVVVSKVRTKTTPKAVSRYLQATTDRRDDSFPDDGTDEFYDASEHHTQQQSKYTMSPVLSNKSSMLSGAMSLD